MTESGFVRLSCNPTVVRDTITPLDAIDALKHLTRLGGHTFWPLDRSMVDMPESIRTRLQGHRQITDAVLLDAAMQRGGQLATFDVGIEGLLTENDRASLYVIPV